MILRKGRTNGGRTNRRMLALGLTVALVAIAATGIQTAIAAGDNNMYNHQLNYGEDGYYEENNNNTFPDDDFPGTDTQNRTGVGE
jgi:hypothetical protein